MRRSLLSEINIPFRLTKAVRLGAPSRNTAWTIREA